MDEDLTFLVGAARLVEFHRLMDAASDDIQLTLPKTLGRSAATEHLGWLLQLDSR
jgi:hypothetical protein